MMIYHIFKYPKILIHSHRGRWKLEKTLKPIIIKHKYYLPENSVGISNS